MQRQGLPTRRPDRSLLRRWAPRAAFLVAAFGANRKNKRSAIGVGHDRRSGTRPARTLLSARCSNWLPWSSQFLLALALLTSMALVPTPASASGRSRTRPARPVSELPELRTRTSTTYRNPDGTRTSVVSLGAVHYPDGGTWLPIDTSVLPAIGRTGYAWQNGSNGFHAFFKPLLIGEYLRFEAEDHVVALTLEGADPLASAVPDGSRLSYASAFPGVDLRYTMLPDEIKEALVLADAGAPEHYRFRMTIPDGAQLQAEEQPDGSWRFSAPPNTPLFSLAAPYARDSGSSSRRPARHASMDVQQTGSEFQIDLNIDPAWLQDPARQFPVVLDPTITVQPDVLDATFVGNCPTCSGATPEGGAFQIGSNYDPIEGSSTFWAALKFSLPSLPANAYVTDGSLGLWYGLSPPCIAWSPGNPSGSCLRDHTLDAYRLAQSWSVSSTTSALGSGATFLSNYDLFYPADPDWMLWDVTGTVRDWVGGQSNFGFLVKRNPDLVQQGGPRAPALSWTGDQTLRPKLEITYHLPPNQPSLDSPASAAALDMTTPVLRATATDPDNDQLDLRFQVASDSTFTTLVRDSDWVPLAVGVNAGTYTVPPGALKDGLTYYWRVQARDEPEQGVFQTSPWSATRNFNVRLKKLGIRDYWPMWSHGPLAINEANGNLVLSLPGPSYPYGTNSMSASVSYNSQASTTTDLGLGPRWTLDTGGDATPPAKLVDHNLLSGDQQFDAVERVSGDGSSDYYTHVGGSNTYLSTPGDGAQLTKNADSTWSLLDSDGAIYSFRAADANGVATLSAIEFVDENAGQVPLYHCYEPTSRKLTSIRTTPTCTFPPTASPPELRFKWASIEPALCTDAILCVAGPDGVTWKYVGDGAHGSSGKLVRINDGTRDLVAIIYNPDPPNGNGLPSTIQNANDLDPSHASPGYNGTHAVTISYDGSNRVQSLSDGPVSNQTPATSTWSFSYFSPCALDPAPTRAAHEGTPLGTYRPNDGCTDLKPPRQQGDPNPKLVRTYYDTLGHPIQVTDQLGGVTMAGYDVRDQLLWSEDEDGNPTDVVYADVEGNATTNPWVATAKLSLTGPDPDKSGPLARPVTRSRYDETRMGEDLLTTSGGLLTDAVRSTGAEGDGRAAPDSSFGLWEGTTNLVTNGGFETNLTGWTGSQATLTRITSRAKFGSASMRATVSGTKTSYSADTSAPLAGATANRTFTGSFWVYAEGSAVGKTLAAILREQGGAFGSQDTTVNQTLAAGWQRLTVTRTLIRNDRTSVHLLASRPSGATSGEYIDLDGAQIEEKAIATPYVQTNGATASRGAARVQAPATPSPNAQGWVAVRMRAELPSAGATLRLFTFGDNANNELYLRYGGGLFAMGRKLSGSGAEAQQAGTFAVGTLVTVIGAWTSSSVKVSVNGSTFSSATNTSVPPIAATLFDLGQRGYSSQDFIDSEILWAAAGTGTLSDADAASISAFGTETPGTWSYPAAANSSLTLPADTTAYQKPLPSPGPRLKGLQASYYANRYLAGRPAKLENDANVSFDWGSGGPPALPGVVDNFSVRWNGYLKVDTTGDYTFATIADDGTRLTIDGTLAIDHWVDQPATRFASQPIHLETGLHKLALDYYENQALASVELRWSCTCGLSEQAIPSTALRPGWFN